MTYTHIPSSAAVESPFWLDSVQAVAAPGGCEGPWQRYIIRQGDNVIVGMRSGQRSEVTVIATEYVERLNLRFAKQRPKSSR